MEEECEILTTLFAVDTQDAIEQCKNIISTVSNFNSFAEFCNYHNEHAHVSICQKQWTTHRMSIHCKNCSKTDTSCLCLECFLGGNHEGHDYFILPNVAGNCDCGDITHLKSQGFCQKHQGLNGEENPENYIDEKLRTTLTDYVFKAALSSLKTNTLEDSINSIQILNFVSYFLRFGDGFRRLVAISLTEKIDLKELIRHITDYDIQFNESLLDLCGKLVNDTVFKNNFSHIVYDVILDDILSKDFDALIGKRRNDNYYQWNSFWFHSFCPQLFQYNIEKYDWDWVTFTLNLSKQLKRAFSFIDNLFYNNKFPNEVDEIIYPIPSCSEIQPNEQTQLFFDKLFTEVLNCGTPDSTINNLIIPASFKDDYDEEHYAAVLHFNMNFYILMKCFKNKPNLKFELLIDELDDKINILPIYLSGKNENENDNHQFIQKYFKDENENKEDDLYESYYYRSFHNGSSFIFANPMFDSFIAIFRNDNLCRVKIARLLSLRRYQSLRIRLGIVTIKSLLAMICYHESIIPRNNFGLILYMHYFVNNPVFASSGIPRYIPTLQLLIGLQCNKRKDDQDPIQSKSKSENEKEKENDDFLYGKDSSDNEIDTDENNEEFGIKEFFAYEIAREIGIFDDYSKIDYSDENIIEQKKQMLFSFLYLSILLVVERDLFNYDEEVFIKEQLIYALKQKPSTFNELSKSFAHQNLRRDHRAQVVNNILATIATESKGKNQDSSNPTPSENEENKYTLKENIEWKTITAINILNKQKMILNDEISKHEDMLFRIQNFESNEEAFFFHSQKENQTTEANKEPDKIINDYDIDSSDLHIRLKEFLFTPTVLAIVYHTLRTNTGIDSSNVELNDQLAMNIILLISKFIKEEEENLPSSPSSTFDESTVIQYNEIPDLIAGLKKFVFNYHTDSNGNTFIQDTLNNNNFNTLLKMKIVYGENSPKSIIDLLFSKGKIGKKVLNDLSIKVEGDQFEKPSEIQDQKLIMKQRVKKIKEDLISRFNTLISNFNIDENEKEDNKNDEDQHFDRETCSICSLNKPNEILSYPIFIYYTKIPFIFDKPPLLDKFNIFEDENQFDEIDRERQTEEKDIENKSIKAQNSIIMKLNSIWEDYPFTSKNSLISFLQNEVTCRISRNNTNKAKGNINKDETFNNRENENNNKNENENDNGNENDNDNDNGNENNNENENNNDNDNENEDNDSSYSDNDIDIEYNKKSDDDNYLKKKYPGSGFVIQYGICQHFVHPECVHKKGFKCPIDRSSKNGFLPCLDEFSQNFALKDKPSEINITTLPFEVVQSILMFISNLYRIYMFYDKTKCDVFVELIKSISGLISTYEIRLRNLPYCLSSKKTKILARNLFLTAWYGYRILGKPRMFDLNLPKDADIPLSIDYKLTLFQKFIKRLIECDEIEFDKIDSYKKIVSEFVNLPEFNPELIASSSGNLKRKKKELCLFLRRACLAEYFLLGNENESKDFEWDDVLSFPNLFSKYNVDFLQVDENEFEFKPFIFTKLPKQFLHFYLKPFNFPIDSTNDYVYFDLFNYKYLFANFDDFDDTEDDKKLDSIDESLKPKLIDQLTIFGEQSVDKETYMLLTYFCVKKSPTVLLYLGKEASKVILIYQGQKAILKSFYVDKNGTPDIGYARNQPLFLREEKLEKFIDEILSGDFTNYLKSLIRMF